MIDLKLRKLPGTALCSQSDPEHWFPGGEPSDPETEPAKAIAAYAKSICNRCPVQNSCLQEAMENEINYGIWGGLTSKERKRLRNQK